MMVSVKIGGVSYMTPSSWEDVSIKMFFELLKLTQSWAEKERYDFIELYSLLLDCPYEVMNKCKQGDVTTLIERNVSFTQQALDIDSLKIPESVKIKGQWLIVPKDLTLESFGEKMAVDSEIQRINQSDMSEIDKRKEQIISICSIYFYKQLTGSSDFDFDAAMKERKWIENASIVQMYPVAVFFSKRSSVLGTSSRKRSLINRMTTSLQRGLKGLIGIRSKQSTT